MLQYYFNIWDYRQCKINVLHSYSTFLVENPLPNITQKMTARCTHSLVVALFIIYNIFHCYSLLFYFIQYVGCRASFYQLEKLNLSEQFSTDMPWFLLQLLSEQSSIIQIYSLPVALSCEEMKLLVECPSVVLNDPRQARSFCVRMCTIVALFQSSFRRKTHSKC